MNLDFVPFPCCLLTDGNVSLVNSELVALVGKAINIGDSFEEFFEDAEEKRAWKAVTTQNRNEIGEIFMSLSPGKIIQLRIKPDSEGRVCVCALDKTIENILSVRDSVFKDLYNRIPSPIYQYNDVGDIVEANTAALETLGYQRDDLKYRKIWSLVGDFDGERAESKERVIAKLEGRREPDQELPVVLLTSTESHSLFRVSDLIVRGTSGEVSGVMSFLKDMNPSPFLVNRLMSFGQIYLRGLDQISGLFVFRKDAEKKLTFINSNLLKYLDMKREDLQGKPTSHLFPYDLSQTYSDQDSQVLNGSVAGGCIQDVTIFNVKNHKSRKQVYYIKSAILDRDKNPVGIQVLFWFVDDSENVIQALEDLSGRYDEPFFDFLRNTSAGAYCCEKHTGDFIAVSSGLAKILEYDTADEMEGFNMEEDLYWEKNDRQINLAALKKADSVDACSVCLRSKSGKQVWVTITARIIESGDGELIQGLVIPISEDRESRIRAAQIRRMQGAQHLSSAIAHKLSNDFHKCINILPSVNDFLKDLDDDGGNMKIIGAVEKSIMDSSKFLKQLMHADPGKLSELNFVESINELLKSVISGQIESGGWKIESLGLEDISCSFSVSAFKCILENLLTNSNQAFKAAKNIDRKINIIASWREISRSEPEYSLSSRILELTLSDNGPGLPSHLVNQIWKKGVSGKSGSENSGFGLFLCKILMDVYLDGEIELHSTDSSGSTFKMKFPIYEKNENTNSR